MSWQPPPAPNKPQEANQQPQQLTYYQILQVDPQSHPTIIRYAYRYLAGIYHPDNAESGNPEMFRIVSDAYKILSDAGRRTAYDAQLGLKPPPKVEPGKVQSVLGAMPEIPKTGLSYNEVELRLAILQVLLTARKKRAQTGGASAKMLMDVLNVNMADMEFVLWYLRERKMVERQEAQFLITVDGVDYLVDSLAKTQVLDDGGKPTKPGDLNLPATI